MKSFRSVQVATLLFCLAMFILSCGGGEHSHDHGDHSHDHGTEHSHSHEDGHSHGAEGAAHGEGTAYTAAYVCPMHCEGSGSEEPGKCPVCNMDYVAQAEHTKDGHNH